MTGLVTYGTKLHFTGIRRGSSVQNSSSRYVEVSTFGVRFISSAQTITIAPPTFRHPDEET